MTENIYKNERKTGRPPIYSSQEERKSETKKKKREYAKKYYEENREEVRKKQVDIYKNNHANHNYKLKSKYANLPQTKKTVNELSEEKSYIINNIQQNDEILNNKKDSVVDDIEKTKEYNGYLRTILETISQQVKQLEDETKLINSICELMVSSDYEAIDELCSQNSPYSFTNYKTIAH